MAEKNITYRACDWCGKKYPARGDPGAANEKRFCSSLGGQSCKRRFERACRRYTFSMLDRGKVTILALKALVEPRAATGRGKP